jgi:hypothetical protein
MSPLCARLTHVSVALSTALTLALASPASAVVKNFMSVLNAGQEVPPTSSKSFGNGFYTFDTVTKALCYSISYSEADLLAAETAAHIHGPASPGVDGVIVFGLPAGSPKQGCQTLDAASESALKKGQLYVNVHTSVNSGGEIRGQIIPVKGK